MIRLTAWWLREKTLLSETAVRIPVWHYFSWFFFFFFFHFVFFSFDISSFCINLNFLIRKSFQMLLNQTDVAEVEELEKVIINIYSSTETDIGDNEYASGETTENLQWNRGVSTAWTSIAYCSECWNLAEVHSSSWNSMKFNKTIIEYKSQKCNLSLNRKKYITYIYNSIICKTKF